MERQNRANYTVTTKNGKAYKWSFTEYKNEGDYGNGIYIGVVSPSGELSSWDCRYLKGYKFEKTCTDYLIRYYGVNFAGLTKDNF